LSDEEMEAGPMSWLRLQDPFGPWHAEEAA